MKKGIMFILAAVLALGAGLAVLSAVNNARNTRTFVADGFILDPSDEEFVTDNVNMEYYFTQGTKYKEKYGTQISFKDATGTNELIDSDHFIHYNDGSLGSFKKGVIMDVSEITESNYGYYSLSKNTVLVKNGGAYEMSSRGEAMNITEFIWKISDRDYMLLSPDVTLKTSGDDVQFSDYVQLTYVDNGIVRISHQSGTYQTVAADSTLVTRGGAELNLVGKNFMVDGEAVLSLDDMTIDDDSYIDIDENIEDGPTIPTFNVINGKDGVNGTDGTDGEQGEAGEEGKEGEEGGEGEAGSEGAMGSTGGLGKDGVEGDTGIMGYDGAEGIAGKDADTAASASQLQSVDLYSRPEIRVNSGENNRSYSVTPGSATMNFNMEDPDNTLTAGSAKVKVYDRETMQLVAGTDKENKQLELGAKIESGSGALTFSGLNADREYVLVVEGEYLPGKGESPQTGILFQKIFRTEPLGIGITKDYVTDTEISAVTKVTGQVDSYNVRFFYYDDNGQKQTIALFNCTSTGATFVVNDTNPAPGTSGRTNSFTDVKSNTTYYAELGNVVVNNELIPTDGSEVELKTLKETPYDYEIYTATATFGERRSVALMTPTITSNDKNHTITVNLNPIADPDCGISSYRIDLFKDSDISSALQTGSMDELVATYSKDLTQLSGHTFSIPSGDLDVYRARVTVMFNDNEKDMEISTLFSNVSDLSAVNTDLMVELLIDENQQSADTISGFIKITDGTGDISSNWNNTSVLQHIGGTNPLVLAISGEYADTYTLKYKDNYETNYTTEWGDIIKSNGNYWLIPFKKEGLHQDSVYTLILSGPQDTNGDGNITGAEASTYFTGTRVNTKTHKPLALAARRLANPQSAFRYSINVTSLSEDADEIGQAQYSASVLERLELQLIHVEDSGLERIVGNATVLADGDTRSHDSYFKDTAFIGRDKTEYNPDAELTGPEESKGLTIKDSEAASDTSVFEITPSDFGIDNNDNALFSGGEFKIKVIGAYDYTLNLADGTGGSGNTIPFKEGENVIRFGISKKHVQANNPNRQVVVDALPNSAAAIGYSEDGIDGSTVVGLRFRADYGYADVNKIYYYIYELDDNYDIASNQLIYPKAPDDFSEGIATVTANPDGTYTYGTDVKCNLVLVGEHTRDGMEYGVRDTELYFKGTKSVGSYVMTWKKPDGSSAEDQDILTRGKRYIIAYRVLADHTITPCIDPDNDHFYPDCAYGSTPVPLYRSAVISLDMQTPVAERYPLSSENGKDIWNYRIIDPDKAIITDNAGKAAFEITKANTYAGVATSTTKSTVNVPGMDDTDGYRNNNDFKALTIDGLGTDGIYYSVGIPYKTLSAASEATKYITSKPVQHFQTQTISANNIYLKGLTWTTNDNAADKLSDGTVAPLVNEGNYRYRLTFMGTDLDKFSAFRVVFSDGNDSVIYDPVYVVDRGELSGSATPYGYAYVDQGPLAAKFSPGTNLSVSVNGYYSTKSSGFDDYEGLMDDYDKGTFYESSTERENLFALRRVNVSDGTTKYIQREDSNWTTTYGLGATTLGSMVIPGNVAGGGLNVTSNPGNRSSAIMDQRYYYNALVSNSQFETAPLSGFTFDENGIHIGENYYVAEKLAKSAFDFGIYDGTDTSNKTLNITMGTVVAAIRQERITAGAKSATLEMSLHGVSTDRIYAKLIQKSGADTVVKLKKNSDDRGEFFEVSTDASTPDYDTTEFKNQTYITVTNNNFTLRLRKLSTETNYGVLFFTYDNAGNERPLYSIDPDKERVNVQYTFKTLKYINIGVTGPSYSYNAYDDKTVSFGFGIPGDEGTGMTVKYKIVSGTDIDNGSVVAEGTIDKLGDPGYQYYSQRADQNNPFSTTMNPGTGRFYLGSTYTVRVWAVDDSDPDEELGFTILPVQTPTSLALPDFRLTATPSENNINASVTCTDSQKAILDGTYTVSLYKRTDTDNAVGSQNVVLTNSGGAEYETVTFNDVDPGDYIVRVEGQADLNNNGRFDETEGDVLVFSEATVSTGSAATASIGSDATVDRLEIEFYNLSNFANVRKIVLTAYNSNGTMVYTTTESGIEVSEDEAKSSSFTKTFDWSSSSIDSDQWYDVKIQYRSGTGGLLGDLDTRVKTETVQTTGE